MNLFEQEMLNKSQSDRLEDARHEWACIGLTYFERMRHVAPCLCVMKNCRFMFKIVNKNSGEIVQICDKCINIIDSVSPIDTVLDGAASLVKDVRAMATVGLLYFGMKQEWITREEGDKYMRFMSMSYKEMLIQARLFRVEINVRLLKRIVIGADFE